jgi:AcrR family transcriptional regulator
VPRYSVDERREQLLSVALDRFSVQPWDAVSMDAIADAAGVSKGLLYHYFPSKRDLYLELLRAADEELRRRATPPADAPPRQRLRASLDGYLAFVEDHPAHYAAVLRGGIGFDDEVWKLVESTRELAVGAVVDALGLRMAPPGLRMALKGWVGLVEAACLEWIDRRDLPRDALLELFVQSLDAAVLNAARVDPRVRRAFVRRWAGLDRLPAFGAGPRYRDGG